MSGYCANSTFTSGSSAHASPAGSTFQMPDVPRSPGPLF